MKITPSSNTYCGSPMIYTLEDDEKLRENPNYKNLRLGIRVQCGIITRDFYGEPDTKGNVYVDISSALRAEFESSDPFASFFEKWNTVGDNDIVTPVQSDMTKEYTIQGFSRYTLDGEEVEKLETTSSEYKTQYASITPLEQYQSSPDSDAPSTPVKSSAPSLVNDEGEQSSSTDSENKPSIDTTRDYKIFAYLDTSRKVQVLYAYTLEACRINIRKDEFNRIRSIAHDTPVSMAICREATLEWDMSSGYTDRNTAGNITMNFLTTRRAYMWCTEIPGMEVDTPYWLPVTITPKNSSTTIYNRAKAEGIEIPFTVKAAYKLTV